MYTILDTDHWYHMDMYHRCTDTMTRHTSGSYSCAPLYRIPSCHLLWASLHGISAYYCYTCMYGFSIHVIWIPVHIACIIVPCYPRISVIRWFPVTDIGIPVTGHESCWYAICGLPHLLFSFPVILFPFPVILFYAINRAHVMLSCYMYHVLYLFLIYCIWKDRELGYGGDLTVD